MKIEVLKKDKAIVLQDVIIAIIILCMFVGVVGSLFYQILLNSALIQANAIAVEYAVKIAEEVDKLQYDDVNQNLGLYIDSNYDMPELLSLTMDVQKYNELDPTKADIIKIVNIKISYTILDETRNYEIQKLKIKEN